MAQFLIFSVNSGLFCNSSLTISVSFKLSDITELDLWRQQLNLMLLSYLNPYFCPVSIIIFRLIPFRRLLNVHRGLL